MTLEDLKVVKSCDPHSEVVQSHQSEFVEPISVNYRGVDIWEIPPNGQGSIYLFVRNLSAIGITALLALNVLSGFDLKQYQPRSSASLHLEIEALRLGFADSRAYVADPAFTKLPIKVSVSLFCRILFLQGLLSPNYAAERRKLVYLDHRNPSIQLLKYCSF